MTKTIDIQPLCRGVYTTKELRLELSKYRKKRVPPRTLRYWIHEIGMVRNEYGFYESSDLKILTQLMGWLSRGGNIQQFRLMLLEKMKNAD